MIEEVVPVSTTTDINDPLWQGMEQAEEESAVFSGKSFDSGHGSSLPVTLKCVPVEEDLDVSHESGEISEDEDIGVKPVGESSDIESKLGEYNRFAFYVTRN